MRDRDAGLRAGAAPPPGASTRLGRARWRRRRCSSSVPVRRDWRLRPPPLGPAATSSSSTSARNPAGSSTSSSASGFRAGAPADRQMRDGAALVAAARAAGVGIVPGATVAGVPSARAKSRRKSADGHVSSPRARRSSRPAPMSAAGRCRAGPCPASRRRAPRRRSGAATGRCPAGARVLVCGSGPLNLQVALELSPRTAPRSWRWPRPPRRRHTRPFAALALAAWVRSRGIWAARRQRGRPELRRRGIPPAPPHQAPAHRSLQLPRPRRPSRRALGPRAALRGPRDPG